MISYVTTMFDLEMVNWWQSIFDRNNKEVYLCIDQLHNKRLEKSRSLNVHCDTNHLNSL